MKISHSELKTIYSKSVEEKRGEPRKNCPSLDELIHLVRSELSSPQKNRLLNHIQECSFCSREVKVILEIIKEEKDFIQKINELSENRNPGKKQRRLLFISINFSRKFITASAVSALLLFLISFSLFKVFDAHPYRGNDKAVLKIIKPKKKVTLYENVINFKWNEVPGTEFYKVILFNDSLYPIWESQKLSQNSVKLPPEVYEKLTHKATYFLWVTSTTKNRKKIESQLKEFKVFVKQPKN